MRVLIVKTSSMGDVVHALPAVSDMARAIPGLQVDWLVEKNFSAIPAQHHAVQRVITLQWRKWRKSLRSAETKAALSQWRAEMKQQPYDLIIDMQGLLKSAGFACFAQGPRAGYDWHSIREPLASLFYQRRAHVSRQLHAVDRCRQLAAQVLGYPLPSTPPDFGMRQADRFWRPAEGPYAVLIPCASRPEKLWPQADWIAVGRHLTSQGLAIAVMWGSPQEQQRAQEIAQATGAIVPPFLTVAEAANCLAHAQIVVGLDTGLTHLAAASGRTTIGIYCDHEPGLAGVTGPGHVQSLGGKGQVPSIQAVLNAMAVAP
ncbi:lipopolysaccharide heptosyltransferase I [Aquabacterium sp. CECT 9606]|uniref:lipopolysaccharide heptosyltransferase I n=1 Tax=Aquabacterium sp. CECT 9606 TaxID=2845822 RepID=UPI001E2ADF53|nr:lipopolysaccharide heptosyltransferase I [Aquabacterium sp. CECT 9606]CAH0354117.1 Lipopolysaccharide heptosyltransferase 1 [Aquabacterium sp. CECT 9606]